MGCDRDSQERKQMVKGNAGKWESSEKEKTRGDVIITIEHEHPSLSFPEPMSWGEQEKSWCIIVHEKEFRKTQKFFFSLSNSFRRKSENNLAEQTPNP